MCGVLKVSDQFHIVAAMGLIPADFSGKCRCSAQKHTRKDVLRGDIDEMKYNNASVKSFFSS